MNRTEAQMKFNYHYLFIYYCHQDVLNTFQELVDCTPKYIAFLKKWNMGGIWNDFNFSRASQDFIFLKRDGVEIARHKQGRDFDPL